MQAIDWAANASFSSIRSRSSTPNPVRSRTFRVAGIGPIPMQSGSTPATAVPTIRAIGAKPSRSARSRPTTSRAAAPSFRPEELPAVTVPSVLKAGRSAASFSASVSGRGCSSVSTTIAGPFRCGTSTGTISSSKRPSSMAAAARRWLSSAKASCSSRVIPQRSATTSAVMPSEIVHSSGIFGFTNRQPSRLSATSGTPRG